MQGNENNLLNVLQINVDRGKQAHDLLYETITRLRISVVILSEPNRKISQTKPWFLDNKIDSAIMITNKKIKVTETGKGDGFIWVKIDDLKIISCYISPNVGIDEYKNFLERLGNEVRKTGSKIIIAGDFNAKSPEWGAPSEDQKGQLVTEWAATLNLGVANCGTTPTFERGQQKSFIDLTLYSEDLSRNVKEWKVLDEETASYHNYINYAIFRKNARTKSAAKFKDGKLDKTKCKQWMTEKIADRGNQSTPKECSTFLQKACKEATPRVRLDENGNAPYWWTLEIQELRKEVLKARRRYTRQRRRQTEDRQEEDELRHSYSTKKKDLKKKIAREKRKCWLQLCQTLEDNPWGDAYQVVTKSLQVPIPRVELPIENKMEIVRGLFPRHIIKPWNLPETKDEDTLKVSEAELLLAVQKLKDGKAPGLDQIPSEAIKILTSIDPMYLCSVLDKLLKEETFPSEWKNAKLVLIPKPRKNKSSPTAYRPICLLNTLGKLYEHIILAKLKDEIERTGGLSEHQHGFRKGRSTYGAIEEVLQLAKVAIRDKKWCTLILLDVRNAFNSASWRGILDVLRKRKISAPIIKLIADYFSNRNIQVDRKQRVEVSAGVPQGSVLGPTLWNLLYDEIFKEKLPEETKLVAFADDLAVVVTAKTGDDLEIRANDVLQTIDIWMAKNSLSLAPEKTEAVLLCGKRRPIPVTFELANTVITPTKSVKYLGVTIDNRINFGDHILTVTNKADKIAAALTRLMPNIGGPKEGKRRVLCSVVHSILLYAAPIWYETLSIKKNLMMLQKTQRKIALRVISAYKTVSTEATLVIASIIPFHLLARERDTVHRSGEGKNVAANEARQKSLEDWQTEWENCSKAAWTRRLIKRIEPWVRRKHGSTDYFLTQFLTGHGRFAAYTKKIGITPEDTCYYCGVEDTPEHTIFECPKWVEERHHLRGINPDNVVEEMLKSKANWENIKKPITNIVMKKEKEEYQRRDQ